MAFNSRHKLLSFHSVSYFTIKLKWHMKNKQQVLIEVKKNTFISIKKLESLDKNNIEV
ncbi:hypothetical protein K502DRAFT_75409 [Neoconidiobolus thromboides FSU 785]|nr:hypothetical protein K502DRAFT_75409 [Neoconidiobolus thromboides FSU 785]